MEPQPEQQQCVGEPQQQQQEQRLLSPVSPGLNIPKAGASLPSLYAELQAAYLEARRHKRRSQGALEFERNQEAELAALATAIRSQRYALSPCTCFLVFQPVKREIFAAHFRDRVVHHWVFRRINATLEKYFIHDSYSCRVGKGTLFGIRRLEGFFKSCTANHTRTAWVLKLDVSGFFMAMDRQILWDILMRHLRKEPALFADGLLEPVLRTIVFHDPTVDGYVQGAPCEWSDLPANKSLFHSAPGCGLPIGNLTSQLFANVYLNELDQYVKRVLKVRHYGRYVDDMVFVHESQAFLRAMIPLVRTFLRERLGLELHPCKIYLQPVEHGAAFLGAYVLPYRTYAGRRVMGNYRAVLRTPVETGWNRLVSYWGLLGLYQGARPGATGKASPPIP